MKTSTHFHWLGDIGAFFLGCLLTLAFAPFNLWPLSFLCPALLIMLWNHAPPRRALIRGGLFGLGFFGLGLSWVYISLNAYGEANVALASLITLLMIMLMASFIALEGYLLARVFPKNTLTKWTLAFPSLWVLCEWTRGWFLTGFPWLFLGYAQLTSPLKGLAPVIGIYGVSWAVAATSGVFMGLFISEKKDLRTALNALVFLGLLWGIAYSLTFTQWTKPIDEPITVSLVQGNVSPSIKWNPEEAQKSFSLYQSLSASHINSDIIVWPEAAITFPPSEIQTQLDKLSKLAKSHHSTIFSGIPLVQEDHYYNGMLALGNGSGTYMKRHLVPFGEFMPFRPVLVWLKNYLQIPMSDFSPGATHQPLLTANGHPIAAYICYEIAYPSEVLDNLPQGQLLITISDDSWFGHSIASSQHLQIAQMRALETGRYLLMVTNDGITAIVNPEGKIQAFAPPFRQFVLTGKVQFMTGQTPWISMGVCPILILMGLLLALAVCIERKILRHPQKGGAP